MLSPPIPILKHSRWLVLALLAIVTPIAGSLFTRASESTVSDRYYTPVIPLGLPSDPALKSFDRWMVDLGKKLFFDRRLSFNNTMSCGMCHIEDQGFASIQSATAVGMEGQSLTRNAPTLLNVVYQKELFHDGREPYLADQVWSPILSPLEMAGPSVGYVIERIKQLDDYPARFKKVFGERGIDMQTVGDAIAAYERSLLSGNSRFDRWKYGGEADALSPLEKKGFELFTGRAKCSVCHTIGEKSALFSDLKYHASGVGYKTIFHPDPPSLNVELEPGKYTTVQTKYIESVTGRLPNDLGRFQLTQIEADRWKYKTPSLRNVAVTYPYMHNGSLVTLEDVVDFYDAGGIDFKGKSELIKPLGLSADEKASLVAFLKSLTGDNVLEEVQPKFYR